ncbi:MAG: class I SAM-dependent methyltransferase [Candidatus Eisenbacteria bacterium]|nr:class I SAM-dependent methyltransferase [Candidatus Eisenbacteria bacterium]
MTFRCKLCGGDRRGRPYALGARAYRFAAADCDACGLFQVLYDWSAAPPHGVTTMHDVASPDWVSDAEMEAHALKATDFASRLEALGSLSAASVLDIGCGEGHFLAACVERGARRVVGQEFRLASIRYARERCGIADVRSAPLEDVDVWPDATFDRVCSFDVIEHVHDLRAYFDQCLRVLKPNGLMFHATPGSDSITHRVGRLLSRLGAGGPAATLCNVQFVSDMVGGPHVHLMGRRSVGWLSVRENLVVHAEYVPSYSYSDRHYAAMLPQLRWLPREIGARAFGAVRHTIRNKLLFWARRA